MTEPTCDDIAPLIDLYAAGECDPCQVKSVRAHLATCDDCRHALDESRCLQGLLAVHFGRPAALSRLEARTKAEARRPRAALPWTPLLRRYASVAALLLVTFGLGLLLTPAGQVPTTIGLELALAERADHAALPARGGPELARGEEGPGAQAVREGTRTGKWPLPPRVDLDVVVSNPGVKPIELEVGGSGFRCVVELSGPEGVTRHAPARPEYVPFPPERRTVEPGGVVKLRLERLVSQVGGRVWYLYPTVVGEYAVRVRLEAAARRGSERGVVRLRTPPMRLHLR